MENIPTSRTSTAGELRATALINPSNLVRVDAYRPDDTRNLGRIKGGGGAGDRAVRFTRRAAIGQQVPQVSGGVRRFARRAESPPVASTFPHRKRLMSSLISHDI